MGIRNTNVASVAIATPRRFIGGLLLRCGRFFARVVAGVHVVDHEGPGPVDLDNRLALLSFWRGRSPALRCERHGTCRGRLASLNGVQKTIKFASTPESLAWEAFLRIRTVPRRRARPPIAATRHA